MIVEKFILFLLRTFSLFRLLPIDLVKWNTLYILISDGIKHYQLYDCEYQSSVVDRVGSLSKRHSTSG